jgi:hypothetical protein
MNRTAFYITFGAFCGLSLLFSLLQFCRIRVFFVGSARSISVLGPQIDPVVPLFNRLHQASWRLRLPSLSQSVIHPPQQRRSPSPQPAHSNTYLFRGFKTKNSTPAPSPGSQPGSHLSPICHRLSPPIFFPSVSHLSHTPGQTAKTAHSSRDHRDNKSSRPETLSNTKQAAESKRWSVRPPYNVNISSSDIAYHS